MQQIEHRRYGKGKVIKQRYGGFELHINFQDEFKRWVRRDEIKFLGRSQILPKHKKHISKIPTDQFIARKTIEALRMGIVPYDSIENFTIGRDPEKKKIENWLNKNSKGTLFLQGEYGSGKSHLLEYIHATALKDEWATAFVEIGYEENPFHKPFQVYQQIISSFLCVINGKKLGFRDFIKEIVHSNNSLKLDSHKFFSVLFRELEKSELNSDEQKEEQIWEWIEGDYNWHKPSLYRMGTAANIYCNIINGISWALHHIFGLKGLLILFDEAEYINVVDYKYQIEKGLDFMNGLIGLSNNNKHLLKEKIMYPLKKGAKTGLTYCGYPRNDPLRFSWQFPSQLKTMFAITPVDSDKNPIKLQKSEIVDLQMLKDDDLLMITFNVVQFYKNAYKIDFQDDLIGILYDKLHHYKTRLFIKYLIESLDIIRFHPEKSLDDILG
ncbi:MAG: DUF2791 family P-loop domain-containing protein [Candidatus Cloacimonetes bacterium]|nr:DUF2791 family P-loop domain-containing protein [Candidatus Cloacimonadota bacterium]